MGERGDRLAGAMILDTMILEGIILNIMILGP